MIGLDQVLTGLVQRTAESKLKWRKTIYDGRFATSVDAISVVIVRSVEETFGEYEYRLDIMDESGETVESLGPEDTTVEQDAELKRLFVLARRSALNIDSILQKLAQGLEL